MSIYSKNVTLVLTEVKRLLPQYGPYSALHDMKAAFQNFRNPAFSYENSAVTKKLIESLLQDGVTLADVQELQHIHNEHCKLLQEYMSSKLSADNQLTTNDVVGEIRELLKSESLPDAAKGTLQEKLYSAEISDLDTSFVFTPSRLKAIDALILANTPPATAFNIIDHSTGDLVNSMPANVDIARGLVSSIIFNIAVEQKVQINEVKEDLLGVLAGRASAYEFKYDYVAAMEAFKNFITAKLITLSPTSFVIAIYTDKFVADLKATVIRAREEMADDLIYSAFLPHLKLPVGYAPTEIAQADVNLMFNMKMAIIDKEVFSPWKRNGTFTLPSPACPQPMQAQATIADSLPMPPQIAAATSNYGLDEYKGMGIGAGTMLLAMLAYNKLATPAYENIVKPIAAGMFKMCDKLGTLFFSTNTSSRKHYHAQQKDNQPLLPLRGSSTFMKSS
jgi:hypothetical protein